MFLQSGFIFYLIAGLSISYAIRVDDKQAIVTTDYASLYCTLGDGNTKPLTISYVVSLGGLDPIPLDEFRAKVTAGIKADKVLWTVLSSQYDDEGNLELDNILAFASDIWQKAGLCQAEENKDDKPAVKKQKKDAKLQQAVEKKDAKQAGEKKDVKQVFGECVRTMVTALKVVGKFRASVVKPSTGG